MKCSDNALCGKEKLHGVRGDGREVRGYEYGKADGAGRGIAIVTMENDKPSEIQFFRGLTVCSRDGSCLALFLRVRRVRHCAVGLCRVHAVTLR